MAWVDCEACVELGVVGDVGDGVTADVIIVGIVMVGAVGGPPSPSERLGS